MKMRELESRFLASIWPIKPPDVLIVFASAVVLSLFGSDPADPPASPAWSWAGVAAGLLVVLVLAVRRVHRWIRVRSAQPPGCR